MNNIKRHLLALAFAFAALVPNVAVTSVQASMAGCAPDIGKKVPVEFVHGFLGEPTNWDAMVQTVKTMVPNIYSRVFDYGAHHTEWVDNPSIGPLLAQRITCLATSSRQAGGLGKVIVVTHSMGGLALRWAANKAPNASEVANDLGLVITIGTPNLGSGWASVGDDLLHALCASSNFADTLGSQSSVSNGSFCSAWSALNAMQDNSQQIRGLPWLPSSVPVLAIAGDLTIKIPLLLAHVADHTHSDLVVSQHSALQGEAHTEAGGGQSVAPCTVNIDVLDPFGYYLLHAGLPGVTAPVCWHSALPHNSSVEQATVAAIKQYLASTNPLVKYVGQWYAHDTGVTIITNGTGKMSYRNYGTCPLPGTRNYIWCYITANFRLVAAARNAVATVTSSSAEASGGQNGIVKGASVIPDGTTFRFALAGPGMVQVDMTGVPYGNGTFDICKYGTSAYVTGKCGA